MRERKRSLEKKEKERDRKQRAIAIGCEQKMQYLFFVGNFDCGFSETENSPSDSKFFTFIPSRNR